MVLAVLAYLAGVLTIVSPCILPVLPFVFARAGQPFTRSVLPMLLGMSGSFALVATLAAVGGGWAVRANAFGRWIALVLLALFGLLLLWPSFSERLMRPLVALGNRANPSGGIAGSLVLGMATGLLWAPCAGPILGLLLTGAALRGASAQTSLLLLAYALGAASSLGLALLVGGRALAWMRRGLGAGEWIRRVLGVAVLAGVVLIASGADTGVLTRLSLARTAHLEQALIDRFGPPGREPSPLASPTDGGAAMAVSDAPLNLGIEGELPALDGVTRWLNSPPLDPAQLRGKVVLVDFWTYSCINCLRALPYVKAWAAKYRDHGLIVIGVHAPEFAFEKDLDNVQRAVRELGIDYPVAIDNQYAIWRRFHNEYWPAHYFIDATGHIRAHHFGEGEYQRSERILQQLLREAGNADVPGGFVQAAGTGVEAGSLTADVGSPETYVGYEQARNFDSPGGALEDRTREYGLPAQLPLNHWGLGGAWRIGAERAELVGANGTIGFEFRARDVHLVLGHTAGGAPVRIRVRLDGQPPGDSHGGDVDASGAGIVRDQRLYQLIRLSGGVREHRVTIEFDGSGAEAYSFTFG